MNIITQDQLASCEFQVDRVNLWEPTVQSLYYTVESPQGDFKRITRSGRVELNSSAGIKVSFPWLAFGVVGESGEAAWRIVRDDEHGYRVELADVAWDTAFAKDGGVLEAYLEQALILSDWGSDVERSLTSEAGKVLDMVCPESLRRTVVATGGKDSIVFIGRVLAEVEGTGPVHSCDADRTVVRVYLTKCGLRICEHIDYKTGQENPVRVFAGVIMPGEEDAPESFPNSRLWCHLWSLVCSDEVVMAKYFRTDR